MNCKEGDLAVIVSSTDHSNMGKIVKVLRLSFCGEKFTDFTGKLSLASPAISGSWVIHCENGLNWECIDGSRKGKFIERSFGDGGLRPIRDNPGADETLSWKDVPQEVKA